MSEDVGISRNMSVFEKLDTNGAAKYLGVTPATIRTYVQQGLLQASRLGLGPKGRLRFTRAQLEAFSNRPAFTDRELPEDL
jgi:excisionase family DNA binding protein